MQEQSLNITDIPVVILAGGRGTRLMEETKIVPKPMVTIGGKPIMLHIMRYYASFGFRKFIVCLGYKGHVIKNYFLELMKHNANLHIRTQSGHYEYENKLFSDWEIVLVETGEHALTAYRLSLVRSYITAPCFCLTYGDGLCNADLRQELDFHAAHGKIGTVLAVHPPSRFGKLEIIGNGTVKSFQEKVSLEHDYINGGYFIFQREFLERLSGDTNQSLEAAPLTNLAVDGHLKAYIHNDFWKCMDTMRDREQLETIFESGKAPWIV